MDFKRFFRIIFMKAIVKTDRKRGASYRDVDVPVLPKDGLLIRVVSASISPMDISVYNWTDESFPEQKMPFVFGEEFCGEVIDAGQLARGFKKDDFISVESHVFCGTCGQCRNERRDICQNLKIIGRDIPGGFSEYAVVPARCAWKHSSDNLKYLGAIMPTFASAANAVLSQELFGKTVIVSGCRPVGLFSISIAKAGGASRVIALDRSAYRRDLAVKMGADYVFDPLSRSTPGKIRKISSGEGADEVIEASGNPAEINNAVNMLRPGGRFIAASKTEDGFSFDYSSFIHNGIKMEGLPGREIFKSWYKMETLLRSGAVDPRPAITHTFQFKDFNKAFSLINKKEQKCGKILLVP